MMSNEERNLNEDERSRAHDALIDSLNILSREMIKKGENAEWRQVIGNDRKEIGDFACYVHCLMGLFCR